jgi:hypothetical protein
MSLSTRIAPHLAYLRRFSRAVTGSQTSGDAYVAAMLEALVADITLYPEGRSDRIALYRLYCTLFDNLDVTLPENTSPFGWERQAAANLANLPRASTLPRAPTFSICRKSASPPCSTKPRATSRGRWQPIS